MSAAVYRLLRWMFPSRMAWHAPVITEGKLEWRDHLEIARRRVP